MDITHIRTRWAAVGAAVAISLGAGGIGITHATTSSGPRAIYTPINPCRLADLRPAPDTVGPRTAGLGPDKDYTLDGWGAVGNCTLPTGTSGLALNVTAVGATAPTFLRLWPANGTLPATSNLNPIPGQPPTPNAVNVGLSPAGKFNVSNRFGTVNVIIDVVGIYDDHNHDDRYYQKSEVDSAVDAKANSADVYTKAEVDTAVGGRLPSASGKLAYAWVCNAAANAGIGVEFDLAACDYNYNAGDSPTSTKSATGVYSVVFPGLDLSAGHVQVTAYGSTNETCKVGGWGGTAVTVRCFDNAGNPVDTRFTVLMLE